MTTEQLLKLNKIIGDPKKGTEPLVPVSRSSWYAGIKSGRFPKGVKLGTRSIAWRASDIAAIAKGMGGNHE